MTSIENILAERPENLLHFHDNRLMIDLCGEFDRNLAQIEGHSGIQIIRRGNELSLIGDEEATQQAAVVLQALYQRLEQGKEVTSAEIDAFYRMQSSEPVKAEPPNRAEQIEMFSSGRLEIKTRKKTVEPRSVTQKQFIEALYGSELVFGLGPAGTGKTYLAVAVGVSMFINGLVDRIILSRPAVEAGERLGFLPGDMKDKVDPYMQPLYDALNDFMPSKQVGKLIEEKRIEVAPLAFMRGRTLANAFVVLDEAQNATTMQMKMFLTRMGEGSRMAITGDMSQIDLPRGVASGLVEASEILRDTKEIKFIEFSSEDVVRHPMVARVIKAYDKHRPKR